MMSTNHELQDRYSSLVLAKLRKTSIFDALFNKRYEGTPTAGAVKIPVRDTEVKVDDYDIVNGGNLTQSATTYKTLPIDKDIYVNEMIDGYEAAAVPDNLVADRLDSAGYSMGRTVDAELMNLLIEQAGNVSKPDSVEGKTVYEIIVDKVQAAKHLGLDPSEMWLAVSNTFYAELLKSPEFITAREATVIDGAVGRIAGVTVYETNALGADDLFILGNNVFCHFVDEWMVAIGVNDLRDGKHIGASAVQGRRVYGDMISRPETVFLHTSRSDKTATYGIAEQMEEPTPKRRR